MPSPFFAATKPYSASPVLLSVALAASGLLLTGCGGNTPTTRTNSDDLVSTPSTATFTLTLQSPVQLTNVEARVIDTISGRVLYQGTISNTDKLLIDLRKADVPSQRLLYVELRPTALNQSSYYDPILDGSAPFNAPLRALVQSNTNNRTVLIDPYSEIAFQRAQIRAGWLTNRTDLSQLSLISMSTLNDANSEVSAVFAVRSNVALTQGLGSRADIQKLNINNNQYNTLNYFIFALGHIQYYVSQQGRQTSPYLNFSQKAAIDMLDGDLDGITLYGFGDQAHIFLNEPLVEPIVNTKPDRNQHALLAIDQFSARNAYNNEGVGESIKQLFNPLFESDSAEFSFINEYDYLNMTARAVSAVPKLFGLHSPGAGNYTRAFGLPSNQLVKNYLNADDTGLVSDIEQIAGTYQNSQNCRLEIRPNGRVILSQGTQRFEADIDRNFNDSMSRTSVSSQAYLLNITTPSDSTPSFLQIRTDGVTILSAQNGRSLLEMPDQLSQVDLSCEF
ncbi:MAG: hypothetical protein WA154_05320 [Moraxellaceae bacterium]